jgi:Adenylylsulfate kinase and related kinases
MCKWILNNKNFISWLDRSPESGSKSRILWIYGRPASGKLVLASFIIRKLQKQGLNPHYFFVRFTSKDKSELEMMLLSSAYQVAHTTEAYAARLKKIRKTRHCFETS